jgi:3-methyladenine DNA glycosylase/8-oxoguanine DNA glycosylase
VWCVLRGVKNLEYKRIMMTLSERCQGVAAAALAGRLDAQRLRALDEAAALTELQSLRGIGP